MHSEVVGCSSFLRPKKLYVGSCSSGTAHSPHAAVVQVSDEQHNVDLTNNYPDKCAVQCFEKCTAVT